MKATNVRFYVGETNEISLGAKVKLDGQIYYAENATAKDVENVCRCGNEEWDLDALMKSFCVYGGDWNDTKITEYTGVTCSDYDSFGGTMDEYEK